MKNITLFVTLLLSAILSNAIAQDTRLNIGDKAPMFSAQSDDGTKWNSEDFYYKDYVIVYFYPAAMTGGCTKQACSFRDNHDKLEKLNATVVGISGDEVENLKYFKMAHQLNFPLLSDPEGRIAKKFGVPLRNGGQIERDIEGQHVTLNRGVTAQRWTFVVDKSGTIIYKDTNVTPEEDSNNVMTAIEKHRKINH